MCTVNMLFWLFWSGVLLLQRAVVFKSLRLWWTGGHRYGLGRFEPSPSAPTEQLTRRTFIEKGGIKKLRWEMYGNVLDNFH